MKYYAAIDTNVIVSAMLIPESVPGMILKYAMAGLIVPLINSEILNEYEIVLRRTKFNFKEESINNVLSWLKKEGIVVCRTQSPEKFIDEKDVVFYEIVLTERTIEDAYLITGNTKHFPKKYFVVTPREMLEIIDNDLLLDHTMFLAENKNKRVEITEQGLVK